MAYEPLTEAVIHKPGIADGAGEAVAAGAAQGQRRIAAAIEKQQRLLAPLDGDPNLFGQTRRNEVAARRSLAPKINQFDLWQMLTAEPGCQRDALVASLARIDLAFDGWRRRG